MLENISYYLIFGKPLILYGGILTLISLLSTATIGMLNHNGKTNISMNYHFWLARITVAFALIHGILGILAYF